MVTLIANEMPAVGIYIMENTDGWVAGNNPGLANLENLSLGNTYIYLQTVTRFDHVISAVTTGSYTNHQLSPTAIGRSGHFTNENEIGTFTIVAEVTNTVAEKCEEFVKLNNRTGDGQKYLVLRYGATDYRQFPYYDGITMKKYIPVITSGVTTTFMGEKDRQQIVIGGWEFWT